MIRSFILSKVILVTGASSGFGRDIAISLSREGYQVFGTSRRTFELDTVNMLTLDVRDDRSVVDCVKSVIDVAGRIDVLINNAGYGLCGAVEDTSIEEAQSQMDTNFFGVVRMINATLPHMRSQGSGRIINISSLAGLAGLPYQGYYSASKFALEGLTESLRLELSASSIDVTCINPGDFNTGFTDARIFSESAKTGVYADVMGRTLEVYERDEKNGAAPALVSSLVKKIVKTNRVGVRYSVGKIDQRIALIIKRIVPACLFEWLFKNIYKLN